MNEWGEIMKSHDENRQLLIPFVLGQLSQEQASQITHHLLECQECSGEVKRLGKILQCARQTENLTADEQLSNSAKEAILAAAQDVQETGPRPTVKMQDVWRVIMERKIIRLAAAAVIIVAVLAGLPFFSGDGSGVALADVLERIEQAQAFIYKMKMTMTGVMLAGMPAGKKEMESTVTVSNEYGMKMEMTVADADSGQKQMTQQMYILPDKKAAIMVMPEQKKFTRMEFDDDLLARMKKQNNDPREMIKQIMRCEYIELGRSVIEGIRVEGFKTTDPAFAGGAVENVKVSLWVDVESWLPVRAEMDFKMTEQMQMHGVIYDYRWDIPVDAGEFEPVLPEDFTAFPTETVQMPSLSEEAAVEGLRFFAEICGQYPKKLNLANLMQEFSALKGSENLTEAGLKLMEEMKQMREQQNAEKVMEIMHKVQSPGMFYMTLVQDGNEPAYHGNSVGPDDADFVLLRWKISDDEYRVILGDLTTENVSAEELDELEKQSSN
jgi:outer membrane lipoprotein-sorting protein